MTGLFPVGEPVGWNVPDVGKSGGEGERVLRAYATHMDGRPRRLHWPRKVRDLTDAVVPSCETGDLLIEHAGQDSQSFGQPFTSLGRCSPRDAQLIMLHPNRAAPDADLDAAPGQHIQGGDHLGQQSRMAKVVVQHEVSDPESLGAGQDEGSGGPGLEGVSIRLARTVEMVEEPERVQSAGLGGESPLEEGVFTQRDLWQVQTDLDRPGAGVAQPAASFSATTRRSSLPVSVRGSSAQPSLLSALS